MSAAAAAIISATGIDDLAKDFVADIKISWKEILYMSLIALGTDSVFQAKLRRSIKTRLGLSLVMTLLLRFAAPIVVYVVIVAVVIACIAGTAFLWVIWHMKKEYYYNNVVNSAC